MSSSRSRRLWIPAFLAVVVAIGMIVAAVVVLREDGSDLADEPDRIGESQLESEIKAPPVPRDLVPSTVSTATTQVPTTTTPLAPGLWVATTGNDANSGTQSAPFRTIRHALTKLKAGDWLYIGDGEYAESDEDTAYRVQNINGSPDKWTVITAAPGATPTLVGGEWTTLKVERSSYVEVRGLQTRGTADVDKLPTTGIEIRESHHVRVVDNDVRNGGGGGVGANQSNHIDIIGNYIANMAKWNAFQTSGIGTFEMANIGGDPGADGYTIRIVGNVVYGTENIALPYDGSKAVTDGNCIIIDSTNPAVYRGTAYIANNVCSNNGGRGIHVFQAGNVVAVNNTLFHNTQTAVLRDTGGELSAVGSSNVVFRNNLVITRDNRKATHVHKASNVTFENNLFAEAVGADVGGSNVVVADPGVRDAAAGDFTLVRASPAIEGGTVETAPETDLRGVVRTGKPDIGAYEAAS